jgi:hypothetical protein
MKRIKFYMRALMAFLWIAVMLTTISSCSDFDKLNEDPNNPETVSPNYILTWVEVGVLSTYTSLGDGEGSDISGAIQYTQYGTQFRSPRINQYIWEKNGWGGYYDYQRNLKIIYNDAKTSGNIFFEAIALTLRASIWGLATDLWGDCPYSESLRANEELFFPKYDDQKDVYQGILSDLKEAEALYTDPQIAQYGINPSSDVLFGGDKNKWRKFNNALRMRYAMRLLEKRSEMNSLGIDVIAEFNDAAKYTFTGNDDDAAIRYIGTNAGNSYSGGPLNNARFTYGTKPSKTIVDFLKATQDPRLYRWAHPVDFKWDWDITSETTVTHVNMFGEAAEVTCLPTTRRDVDTSFYVGLAMNLGGLDVVKYNSGDYAESWYEEHSPFVSVLHDRYRTNADEYLKLEIISYREIEFLLAEAAQRGGFQISGSAEEHYKAGVIASLARWGITDGANGFNFNEFYNGEKVDLATADNKIERIMEQKWVGLWSTIEPWFDYRRTGYPDFKVGPGAGYGQAVPLRFIYGSINQDEQYLEKYNAAVEKLEPTVYVPAGQSKDHNYSKMWLLQGTGKPY